MLRCRIVNTRSPRPKLLRTAGIVIAAGIPVLLIALALGGDYKLNRTVREAYLRMIQVEILSSTMAMDFRMVFHEDRSVVDMWNDDTEDWVRFMELAYRGSSRNISGDTEIFFSRGKLSNYRQESQASPLLKYITIDFALAGSSKTRGLILFSSGAWHVQK